MYPKPINLGFYSDTAKFIAILFLVAIILFIISAVQLARLQVEAYSIVLRAFAIVTIAVPPALPIALVIGTAIAVSKLKYVYLVRQQH